MNKRKIIITTISCFGLLLVFTKGPERVIKAVFSPIGIFFSGIGENFKNYSTAVSTIGNLQKDNQKLENKISVLMSEISTMEEAKKENDNLRKLLKFTQTTKANYVSGEVIFYDPSNSRQAIMINRGTKDNVKNGNPVISEGYIIGRISETGETSSKVLLAIDPDSIIPAAVQATSSTGLIKGQIGFGLLLDNVPQGEKISKGDIVITSGLGGELPRGLIIGTIDEVNSRDNGIYQQARVRPAANLKNLRQVLILH